MSSTIELGIVDPSDTKEERIVAEALQSLVNNGIDAASAAQAVDEAIVNECRNAREQYLARSSSTKDQPEDASTRGPSPHGWRHYLWHCLGKAAIAIPVDHPGQQKLIEFLKELQRLPKHAVPTLLNGQLGTMELWSLTPFKRYSDLEQWLWELDQGHFTGGRQVETSDATALSYQGFSAFLAMLLAQGVAEATRLSALIRPSPFAIENPLKSDAKAYEPYASAAAQWILHAGDALYEMCVKDTLIEVGKQKWTQSLWNDRKAKFEAIVSADRFSSQGRKLASLAAERMAEIEKKGVTTNVVGHFGFMSQNEDGEYDA